MATLELLNVRLNWKLIDFEETLNENMRINDIFTMDFFLSKSIFWIYSEILYANTIKFRVVNFKTVT